MNNNGPVVVIEDDIDDIALLEIVFHKLKYSNELLFFQDGEAALDYLNASDKMPFLILSDINMPKVDGIALRNKIKENTKLEMKCIPYLFFTTASSRKAVIDAYSLSVQGFFVKQGSIADLEKTIKIIIEYWKICAAPNNF